ncbi:histidine kinase dimerization/phospho-acceptor domain-containing protein [Mesorhizobium xinjiangense]|uniref:histidine kinase dimerization/phospho-acceptor domain-containing protein n=1 Tax=Mesorhizobium xinjiangense TaxID=2678685 RepID=UPI0012ECCD8C|nr:histidine kinase dimerization/phospho-acceptor domain-containing protein [Mesorhizobium xinjiangense]
MASSEYSFIDIAVLDEVRQRFAAGDALIILSADLAEVIWANGPGAALIGFADIEAVMGAPPPFSPTACRQIAATAGFPEIGSDRPLIVRFSRGLSSRPIPFFASTLSLPDGERAILLANPRSEGGGPSNAHDAATHAISGISNAGYFAALIGADGMLAVTPGFEELGISEDAVGAMVAEAKGAPGRLVKRHLPASARRIPAGIARICDDPLSCLLIAVDAVDPLPADSDDAAGDQPFLVPLATPPEDHTVAASEATAGAGDMPASPERDVQDTLDASPERAASDLPDGEVNDAAEPPADATHEPARALPPGPLRFVWRTDAEGCFSQISNEFAAAVNGLALDLTGRPFREVVRLLGLDAGDDIADLLERRDTWSGRTVLWPVAGTGKRVPVDLAALPTYSRERAFEGFRGFGIARFGDLVDDHDAGQTPAVDDADEEEAEAPIDPHPPAGEADSEAEKVVHLAEHRPAERHDGLSEAERNAFREIGQQLKTATDRRDATQDNEPVSDQSEPSDEIQPGPPSTDHPAEDEAAASTAPHEAVPGEQDDDSAEQVPSTDDAEAPPPIMAEPEPADRWPDPVLLPSAFAGEMARQAAVDRAFVSGLPLPLLVHRGDVLHFANEAFWRLTGYESLDDLRAAGGLDALFVAPYSTEDAPGAPQEGLMLRSRAGAEFPVSAHLQSIPWEDGKALLLALVQQDAGPQGEASAPPAAAQPAEETLRAEVEEMRTILDTATDGVVLIAEDGTIRSINGSAAALFGLDNAEIVGKPFTALFAVESQRGARDYLHGLAENGVASVLNDGREVIGREAQGRFIPLFMTIGRLPAGRGFCAVMRDITQWKRAEEELTQARTLAERASSQKSDFLARISHEIRTPLNAIIGFSELMIDEKFGPIGNGRYRDYLRDINRSGNHVLDLVNDLLDISKIEAGGQEMTYEAVSLNEALAETVAMMQPQANRERVIIRSSFASRLPDVVADLRSVRQIALNLLSNAIRFTQPGGQVIVSTAYEASGEIVMRVRDTGIGMSAVEIEQALKPFKQVNTLKRSRMDGTGLGLPLTKAMVEANRARFAIHSTPGDGTLVEITFPSTRVLAE